MELTAAAVREGLGGLGKTTVGRHEAFLHLKVTGKGARALPVEEFSRLRHIQVVDLSDNELDDAAAGEALSLLPDLRTLVLAGNRLGPYCLPWAPRIPDDTGDDTDFSVITGSVLDVADLSRNRIETLQPPIPADGESRSRIGLPCHANLRVLRLDGNQLRSLQGVSALAELQELHVADNRVAELPPRTLSDTALRVIDLRGNAMRTCDGLDEAPQLTTVLLARNPVTSLRALRGLAMLVSLDLSDTAVRDWAELRHLRRLALLSRLDLRGTPLMGEQGARERVLVRLPQLSELNGEAVTSEDRVAAANAHGADVAARRATLAKHVPEAKWEDHAPPMDGPGGKDEEEWRVGEDGGVDADSPEAIAEEEANWAAYRASRAMVANAVSAGVDSGVMHEKRAAATREAAGTMAGSLLSEATVTVGETVTVSLRRAAEARARGEEP